VRVGYGHLAAGRVAGRGRAKNYITDLYFVYAELANPD
jgi:hypothetical protein